MARVLRQRGRGCLHKTRAHRRCARLLNASLLARVRASGVPVWHHNLGSKMDLVKTLMRRDGLSRDEALELIDELRVDVLAGMDPEEVLYSVGLEPDYIFDLLEGVI